MRVSHFRTRCVSRLSVQLAKLDIRKRRTSSSARRIKAGEASFATSSLTTLVPVSAANRRADLPDECPLLGAKQTSRRFAAIAAQACRIAFCVEIAPRRWTRVQSWIYRCKPLISNDQILAQLEKFPSNINTNWMSLNRRVPGSSPGAPTTQSSGLELRSPLSHLCCRNRGFSHLCESLYSVSASKKGHFRPLSLPPESPFPALSGDRFDDWLVGHQFVPYNLHHAVFPNRTFSGRRSSARFLRGFAAFHF